MELVLLKGFGHTRSFGFQEISTLFGIHQHVRSQVIVLVVFKLRGGGYDAIVRCNGESGEREGCYRRCKGTGATNASSHCGCADRPFEISIIFCA